MNPILESLHGGLIASCQPVDDGPMDRPDIVAAMAKAAVAGGAVGLRVEGVENLHSARAVVDVPIIGIVKTDSTDTPVRITVSTDHVGALVEAGADIVAYDATDRPRLHDREDILSSILDAGALAMADCATLQDGETALANGAVILGTTMSGYTADTAHLGNNPDFELIKAFRKLGGFVMAEGRYDTPELCAAALRAGAHAVTVGSSLTRLEIVAGRFSSAIHAAAGEARLSGFAVDLGGTKTSAARIEAGQVVQHIQKPTQGEADPDAQIGQIAELLNQLGYQADDLLGVAVTGRVDQVGNWSSINSATLTKINAVPLEEIIKSTIGPVAVINDAAAATLAEYRLGSGRGHENFAFITVSTGVGGGLILNGRLHQSPNGLAGHIGFTSAPGGNAMCGSGRFGTVESVSSGRAIAHAALNAGFADMDAKAVFQHARAGAGWAHTLIEKSAHGVAELAADLVALLGVTRIALGGSIGLADGYLERVNSHLSVQPTLFHAEMVHTELAAHGPLIGALLMADEDR